MTDTTIRPVHRRLGRHLRRNLIAYLALFVAISMTPLPSYAAGLVTSKKIKNNTIKSIDVRNNSLQSVDVRDGSLTGADLGAGSVSAGKLAGGALTAAKLGTIVERRNEVDIQNATGEAVSVSCLAGERLITGGVTTAGVGTDNGWSLIRSGGEGNTWSAAARNNTGSEGTLIVQAFCLQ